MLLFGLDSSYIGRSVFDWLYNFIFRAMNHKMYILKREYSDRPNQILKAAFRRFESRDIWVGGG